MKKRTRILAVTVAVLAAGTLFLTLTNTGHKAQFVIGGALVNLGYRMQDHLTAYDMDEQHAHGITAQQVWDELERQNGLAAGVRHKFPRTPHHPLVAMVTCMDARIDTNELAGDTRMYYYVLRTAGSVLAEKEIEMLELAVANGVKVIVWTTHTDCAAEGVAADDDKRARYPALTRAMDTRELQVKQLLARPLIAERVAAGELLVKQRRIDTRVDELTTKK